ncbi:unnamed protein product [Gadus morhua 'NCC']
MKEDSGHGNPFLLPPPPLSGSRPPGEVIMRAGQEWVHVAGREMDNCVRRELAQMVTGEKQRTPAVMVLTLALGQTDVGRANSSPGSISMRSLKVTQKRLCSGARQPRPPRWFDSLSTETSRVARSSPRIPTHLRNHSLGVPEL